MFTSHGPSAQGSLILSILSRRSCGGMLSLMATLYWIRGSSHLKVFAHDSAFKLSRSSHCASLNLR
jgi:hypothetical protein